MTFLNIFKTCPVFGVWEIIRPILMILTALRQLITITSALSWMSTDQSFFWRDVFYNLIGAIWIKKHIISILPLAFVLVFMRCVINSKTQFTNIYVLIQKHSYFTLISFCNLGKHLNTCLHELFSQGHFRCQYLWSLKFAMPCMNLNNEYWTFRYDILHQFCI